MIEEEVFNAKYHLSIAKRLGQSYSSFEHKRLLIGLINELAKATSHLIRAFLMYENRRKLRDFTEKIAPKYLDKKTAANLIKILEVQKAQKTSPIEFSKNDKIILLIKGKYRFLTVERLKEFLDSAEVATAQFSKIFGKYKKVNALENSGQDGKIW